MSFRLWRLFSEDVASKSAASFDLVLGLLEALRGTAMCLHLWHGYSLDKI